MSLRQCWGTRKAVLDFVKLPKWLIQLKTLGMAEHYQHFFSIRATLENPTRVSFDVLSTPITDELILFLGIKIYRDIKHYVSHLMECQNLNNVGLQTLAEV